MEDVEANWALVVELMDHPVTRENALGYFDPARMEQIVSTFGPILQSQGSITQVPAPSSLYTNEFVPTGKEFVPPQ